jgi:arabinofuranosyltransferase
VVTEEQSMKKWEMLLIAVAVIAFLFSVQHWNFLCDDAFISFRYAENFSEGHGLRYNIDENPPVEGYSNFLWVLILTILMKFGASLLVASRAVSIVCGVILLGMVYRTCRRTLSLDRLQSFMGTLACAILPPFAVWSTGGLETMLFSLCFFLLFMVLLNARESFPLRRAAALGLLLMISRPEGIGYSVLLAAIAAVYYRHSGRPAAWRRGIGTYGIVLAAGVVILTLFRLIYFHAPLPNTFYAKVGFDMNQLVRGLYYVVHFFLVFPGALIILVSSATALILKKHAFILVPVAGLAFIFLLIQIVLGGDFMAMARFMVPLVPLLGLLLAATLCPRARTLKRPAGMVLLLVATAALGVNLLPNFDLHATPGKWREKVHFRWNNEYYMSEKQYWERMKINVEQWTLIGNLLRSFEIPDQSIVTGGIGAIGYYSKMRVYDMYGLVSREVARGEIPRDQMSAGHDKSVDPFFFARYRPDYVDPRLVPVEDLESWKIKMMRSLLVRSKSQSRSNLRDRFLRFQEDYTVITHPVSYVFEGMPMIFMAVRLKETMPRQTPQ